MIEHNYKKIQGWFNMENQYLELLDLVPEGGLFVELGSWKGKSTSFMATEIANKGKKINFFTVDAFKGATNNPEPYEISSYKTDNEIVFNEFVSNTAHLTDYFSVIVEESDRASRHFVDGSVDAIFIDAGHSYEAVRDDIKSWLPKMKIGSTMSGHDFNWTGVKKAVLESLGQPDKTENVCWFKKIQ